MEIELPTSKIWTSGWTYAKKGGRPLNAHLSHMEGRSRRSQIESQFGSREATRQQKLNATESIKSNYNSIANDTFQ